MPQGCICIPPREHAAAMAWQEQTVPIPRDVPAQEEGLGRSIIPVPLPPIRPTAGPGLGMALADGCNLSQGLWQRLWVRAWRGRNNPDAKTCYGHSRASVSPASSKATSIIGEASQDAKKLLPPFFWEPIPQIQDTHVTHPCPTAAWLPAMLAWDLSNFWETEGLGEPSAPSSGTLCHCWGSVLTQGCGSATSPPDVRVPGSPS